MIKSVKIEGFAFRLCLIAAGAAILTIGYFFAKWCFANAVAANAVNLEMAELAISLAPNDSQSHYAMAILEDKNFSAESSARALAEFETAVALNPQDYRLWLALGRARERNGDAAGAESAVRKSLELAPNYALVQWTFGNILLRRGKNQEAFAELALAAAKNPDYRLPLINTAWQISDGDFETLKRNIGDSAAINSALVLFLTKQKRFDEAAQIWNNLPAADRKTIYKTDGEQFYGELLTAKKYRLAIQVRQSLAISENEEKFVAGKISNGGFETDIGRNQTEFFDWKIADGGEPQIGVSEEQKNSGGRSLMLIFNSLDGREFRQISQTVAVESNRRYNLEFFYKSDLKTTTTFAWDIIDTSDGKVLAVSNAVAANAAWTNLNTEFTTGTATEAVTVRLVRAACKSIVCPVTGKIWFDDFSIK